ETCGFREANRERNHMKYLLCKGLPYHGGGDRTGAQTERRGSAGPVGGLLGSKDPTDRVFAVCSSPRAVLQTVRAFGTVCKTILHLRFFSRRRRPCINTHRDRRTRRRCR